MRNLFACFLLLLASIAINGCAHDRIGETEKELLKVLAYEKVSDSSLEFFHATFDPHESQLMNHEEILQFLRKAKISIDTLPVSLQRALEESKVVGMLIPRFLPVSQDSSSPVPKMLNETGRMLLQWEIQLEQSGDGGGSHYGTGALWFEEDTECKAGRKKCEDYLCDTRSDCGDPRIFCIGLVKCPPCKECTCCEFHL